MVDSYFPGNVIRLTATFTVGVALTDPTTVTLKVLYPKGTAPEEYTYALAQITKSAVGVYYKDITLSAAGDHLYYDWIGTGACVSRTEEYFYVKATVIA